MRYNDCSQDCRGKCKHNHSSTQGNDESQYAEIGNSQIPSSAPKMLCPLERLQSNGMNNVNEGGFTCINMIVDSGACDSVIPTEMLPMVPISTQNAQFGSTYQVANGGPISNEGEKSFQAFTNEGSLKTFNMQVAKGQGL